MEQYQGRETWNCASMADGGLSVPTPGTTEMLLLSADKLDTHHLVSQRKPLNSASPLLVYITKISPADLI